jgi:hypothetical protein
MPLITEIELRDAAKELRNSLKDLEAAVAKEAKAEAEAKAEKNKASKLQSKVDLKVHGKKILAAVSLGNNYKSLQS